jgi:hypothetical protein
VQVSASAEVAVATNLNQADPTPCAGALKWQLKTGSLGTVVNVALLNVTDVPHSIVPAHAQSSNGFGQVLPTQELPSPP